MTAAPDWPQYRVSMVGCGFMNVVLLVLKSPEASFTDRKHIPARYCCSFTHKTLENSKFMYHKTKHSKRNHIFAKLSTQITSSRTICSPAEETHPASFSLFNPVQKNTSSEPHEASGNFCWAGGK